MESVEKRVKECRTCIEQLIPRREPMIPAQIPEKTWLEIGMDICYFEGKHFLVVCDYYSHYIEVVQIEK